MSKHFLRKYTSTENKYKENLRKATKMSDAELKKALEDAPDCWRGLNFNDWLYDREVLPTKIELIYRKLIDLCNDLELDETEAVILYLKERFEMEFEKPVGIPDWFMGE